MSSQQVVHRCGAVFGFRVEVNSYSSEAVVTKVKIQN